MVVLNVQQLNGRVEDIALSPRGIISVSGDVRSAILMIPPVMETDSFLARVSDLLRRTGVEDAEKLIRELEVRMAPPLSALTIGFDPSTQRITALATSTFE